MERPRVTAAQIARLAGVGRAAVSNWRKRHPDFPAPVAGTATSPEFDLDQVESWLRQQGKLPQLSDVDRLWQQLLAAGDNPTATLGLLGEALLARRRGEPAPTGDVDADLAPLLATAADLADQHGEQGIFDQLWQRHDQLPTRRSASTPADLADLMAGLAGAGGGTVLDPACGTGELLQAAVRAGSTTTYGQELDPDLARLAGLWLDLRAATDRPVLTVTIHTGDSLRADAFPAERVDAVLLHPPFGATHWGQEELGYDPRWTYGTPPRTEPELAWVQHALGHLRPEGWAVLLMPPAVASRRAGRRIRAELLRRGALRAVIALPARAAAPHGVPLHLWVLRNPVPDAPVPGQVLLIDAAGGADGDQSADYPRILETFRRFAADPEAPIEEPGYARTVPVIELLDEEVDLTPARRQPAASAESSGEHLVRTRERLAALVTELPALIPQVRPGPAESGAPLVLSIAELVKMGALQLIGPVRRAVAVGDARSDGKTDDLPVLTAQDVLLGQPASGRLETPLQPRTTVWAGDVLVPTVARQLTARVVTGDDAPLLGRNLYLLRPDPAALDSWFLAGQLRTTANEKQTSSLSGTLRFDIRRAQVPWISLSEQRQIGEAFRRLDAFDIALRHTAALGADLVRMTADGLASGALQSGGEPRGKPR